MDSNDLIQFIKGRRSYRKFLDKEIPENELGQLIDTIKHCPTNSNNQDTRLTIIKDRQKLKEVSDVCVNFFKIKAEVASKAFPRTEEDQRLIDYGAKLLELQKTDIDPIFYNASAVIIFHTDKDCCQRNDNCVIASTTMSIIARSMGIESTYMGLFEYASQSSKEIWDVINLPETDQIYSAIILGYPSYEYPNDIERKPLNVTWF
jgi:nitroreductase